MDRNTIIGLSLIFVLLMVWQQMVAPSQEELAAQQQMRDSLAAIQEQPSEELAVMQERSFSGGAGVEGIEQLVEGDSASMTLLKSVYGPFAGSATGEAKAVVLENEWMKITFSTRGGRITEAMLKKHSKIILDSAGNEIKIPLVLLEDPKNAFSYFLPLPGTEKGGIATQSLFFDVSKKTDNSISFVAGDKSGVYFEQTYTINPDNYLLDYEISSNGLTGVPEGNLDLTWINYLDKIEINNKVEQTYGGLYFKTTEDGVDYLSKRADDEEQFDESKVEWVSNSNQFFNSTLFAANGFLGGATAIEVMGNDARDLKKCEATLKVPANTSFGMQWYIGPNEFKRMKAIDPDFTDVIPFGSSILGTINRWIIRPVFTFLASLIGSMGVVILILTLIVKMVLYPLTYKMLYSQSKMGALKPQIEGLKDKFKGDQQAQQMETMKLYREFGVNPLGGCMPMLLQMPIWIALYRFFPASIEFRQASFLWATDLSSYDVFLRLPFEVPLGFGSHVSLFTMLWALTTLIYTYYNTKDMDMSANPAMKYMQYVMPIFFLGFFNSYASGLTCYLLFSNIINIAQTLITKNVIIDQNKIREELDAYKKKPKKKGGFQERLENALKEQQRIAADREAGKGKKK